MRICIASGVNSDGVGGTPKSTLDMTIALKQRGFSVILLGDYSRSPEELAIINKHSIPYYALAMTGFFCFPWIACAKIINAFKPDVIISTHRGCDINCYILATFFSIKIISVVRIIPSRNREKKLATEKIRNILWHHALRHNNAVIGISGIVTNDIIQVMKVSAQRVHCIYEGIDADYFTIFPNQSVIEFKRLLQQQIPQYDPENKLCILCGRLSPIKRPENLITLAEHCFGPVQFAYVGSGECEAALREIVKQKSLEQKVLFFGEQKDMALVYNVAFVLIHLCEDEAFGRVIMEANACGKPVIAVQSGALPEIIQQGKTGYLFYRGDYSGASVYIQKLLDDEKHYTELCINARALAERGFTRERLVLDFGWVLRFI